MTSMRFVASFSSQQKNQVEQHKHRHNHLQREHAALIDLDDHEFVKLLRRFQFFAHESLVIVDSDFC